MIGVELSTAARLGIAGDSRPLGRYPQGGVASGSLQARGQSAPLRVTRGAAVVCGVNLPGGHLLEHLAGYREAHDRGAAGGTGRGDKRAFGTARVRE